MTTLQDLIERVRTGSRDNPVRDAFNATVSSTSATSITLLDGTKVAPQSILSTTKFETMLVTDKPSTVSATVQRGWYGSTPTTFAIGDTILVNPRHTYAQLREAVNAALSAITPWMGRKEWDTSQSFSSTKYLLTVPATAIKVFAVGELESGITRFRRLPFAFESDLPTAASATGKGVRLIGTFPTSGTVYIGYVLPWTKLNAMTDTLDSDYPADAEDCIVDGANAYLADRDVFRRMAYDAPHARTGANLNELGQMGVAARAAFQRFFARRYELQAEYGSTDLGWLK